MKYLPEAQFPRSISLHRSLQKGRYGLSSHGVFFLHIGQVTIIKEVCGLRKSDVLRLTVADPRPLIDDASNQIVLMRFGYLDRLEISRLDVVYAAIVN